MYHFIGIAFNAFLKVDHEIDIYIINSVGVIFFLWKPPLQTHHRPIQTCQTCYTNDKPTVGTWVY